ncbi:hypothetical protein ACO2RV_17200 [Ancylobacter sp. VNQ12]|uniref:hypothetical protein n=1 Tax=Ancylobacter sp. VNQ12 TaxID=3400920 RepID=UPI003C09A976
MTDMPRPTESRAPRFDPTINLGHVITMGSVLATMIAGYATLNARMGVVEAQITTMTTLMERSIRADEQLQTMRTTVDKLEDRLERVEQK